VKRITQIHNSDLSWDGRSIRWPRTHTEGIPGGDSKLWMCAQDLGTEIWAHFNRLRQPAGRDDVEGVRLEDCSPALQKILVEAIPFNHYREDLRRALCNFVKMVAQEFVLHGKIMFEVQGGWNRFKTPATLEAATIASIPRDSVLQLGPWTFQLIPPDVKAESGVSCVILLERSHMVVFIPPRRWRGELSRLRAIFPVVNKLENEWMMGIGHVEQPEDFRTVNLAHSIQQARLATAIGWNARGLLRDNISDFHWMVRELRWKRFSIEVRDAILSKVSEIFSIIGTWKDEHPRLVTEGLPTLKQVKESEERLMSKGAQFDELLKPFKI
jgi:hypothetical protein